MGLSSSQARLLTLTGRMHDIEYKAQKLEAQKLQLANETRQVYENYLNAIDSNKIQHKTLDDMGNISFVDTNYNNFFGKFVNNSMYILTDRKTCKIYVPENIQQAYNASNKSLDGYLRTLNSITEVDDTVYTSISNAEELKALSNSNGNYKLETDLTLSDWSGIENFSGTFDGNGHTITIENGTNGLFKKTSGATIKNIEVKANVVKDGNSVGILIGHAENTDIYNAHTSGSVTGYRAIGGLLGYCIGDTTITNCSSSATVISNLISPNNGYDSSESSDYATYVGGLIGFANGNSSNTLTITDCTATGDVISEYWIIGGLIGRINSNAEIDNCNTFGDVYSNYSGKGDDYKPIYSGGTRYYPKTSTYVGTTGSNIIINVSNSNANGLAYGNGDSSLNKFDDFAWGYGATVNFNNFHSALKNTTYTVPNESIHIDDIDPNSYPNLTYAELNQAILYFQILKENGGIIVPEEYKNSTEWLTNIVSSGFATISKIDIKGESNYSVYDVSVSIDTNLQEIIDKKELRKAEVKYEADMKTIDLKDRKYDTDLAALEAERNAIKQEIETLKTLAKDNVERTFKLFS